MRLPDWDLLPPTEFLDRPASGGSACSPHTAPTRPGRAGSRPSREARTSPTAIWPQWTTSSAPRCAGGLLVRLEAAFRARAELWAAVLHRHLDAGPLRGPNELATTLVAARNRLQPLRRLSADPRLPEEVRSALADALRKMVNEAQESLERSARRQPHGAEQLLAVMRENNLPAALTAPPSAPGAARPATPAPPVGRRVIF